MQQPPDRPQGFPVWAVVALAVVATAGGVWWITRSDPKSSTTPVATRAPCQPLSATSGSPSSPEGSSLTKDWEITVTRAAAEPSVPADDGGTFTAAPGEVFIVVEVTFKNLHPGTEAPVSTTLAHLNCADGTDRAMAGFDRGKGYCRVCNLDLGTDQRRVRWAFIFRMDRKFLAQQFRFGYDTAAPIELSLTQ